MPGPRGWRSGPGRHVRSPLPVVWRAGGWRGRVVNLQRGWRCQSFVSGVTTDHNRNIFRGAQSSQFQARPSREAGRPRAGLTLFGCGVPPTPGAALKQPNSAPPAGAGCRCGLPGLGPRCGWVSRFTPKRFAGAPAFLSLSGVPTSLRRRPGLSAAAPTTRAPHHSRLAGRRRVPSALRGGYWAQATGRSRTLGPAPGFPWP